jgi:hypothetical protein
MMIVPKRLGSERSTPAIGMPKRSRSKPNRTSRRADGAAGRSDIRAKVLDEALASCRGGVRGLFGGGLCSRLGGGFGLGAHQRVKLLLPLRAPS